MSITSSSKPNASPNKVDKMPYGTGAEDAGMTFVMPSKRPSTSGKKSSVEMKRVRGGASGPVREARGRRWLQVRRTAASAALGEVGIN